MKSRACPGIKPWMWVAAMCVSLAMWFALGWIVLTAMVVGGGG